ncbi:MAG: hypothetical protein PUC40_08610 [Lachnospiraceae bacterium]|nr:hypothetical protein [Lachnospiraceae bacterium]
MKISNDEYYLMHKNIPVCLLEINDDGFISNIRRNLKAAEHFPPGAQMNDIKFHEWWNDRAIPKTRHGSKNALQRLGYSSTGSALVNNLALSLSDCYWIKPRGEDISWEDVNLFTNDFVDSFGELTINPDEELDLRKRTRFDCAASQGELQKKWCIAKDGRRYMIKGNYGESYQQSLNEIFATKLHKQLGFKNYTTYLPVKLKTVNDTEGLGCMSYDFCCENIECISAWEVISMGKIRQNESFFYPLKEACKSLGMSEGYFNSFMDYEIMTDFLMTNTDRHMNNISIIRNPDTLELLGFAPIYDSGNSMFYNVATDQLTHIDLRKITTHSFIKKEIELLKYVTDRKILNLSNSDMDFSIYEKDTSDRHARIPVIESLYKRKQDLLSEFQNGKDIWKNQKYYIC